MDASHEPENYYKILGVDPGATASRIEETFAALRADFLQQARDPEDDPHYHRIKYAYEVLSNPERRATYDALLAEAFDPALNIDIQASREQIAVSNTSQLVYLLVNVRPAEQTSKGRLPLNLCLVLDRSTSMQEERLEFVKSAVALIVEQLLPDDVLSVVSFSDRAEVVLPAGHVDNKQLVLGKIRAIRASGGTEIYQGLAEGVKQMQSVPLAQYNNHLILLTDGHTYGDADACQQLAERTAVRGIGFSAFGIGSEWNDEFLDKLVAPSGGQSGFIEKPRRIIDFLQNRIKGLGTIYAKNLRLAQNFPDSLQLQYGFKLSPFAQPLNLGTQEIALGDLEGRVSLSFLLELEIGAQPIETRISFPIILAADMPSQQMQKRTFRHPCQLLVLSQVPQEEPPPALVKAVRMLNLYRMNEKIWHDVEAGQLEVATTRMRHLTTRFLEAGETKLAQQASAEAQRLEAMGALSVEGRKQLKYGTRALLSQTLRLNSDD